MFDSLIILNTNNLPDGEVDRTRFPSTSLFYKYLLYDALFLAFHSSMDLLKHWFPFPLLLSALNSRYTPREKSELMAPFRRTQDQGGVVAFPLMVPVRPDDKYVDDFRRARIFLATQWKKPTLVLYSDVSVLGNGQHSRSVRPTRLSIATLDEKSPNPDPITCVPEFFFSFLGFSRLFMAS